MTAASVEPTVTAVVDQLYPTVEPAASDVPTVVDQLCQAVEPAASDVPAVVDQPSPAVVQAVSVEPAVGYPSPQDMGEVGGYSHSL